MASAGATSAPAGEALGLHVFLFHDVERSTEIWSANTEATFESIEALETVTTGIVERYGGAVFKHVGDGSRCVFGAAGEAVSAAIELHEQVTEATGGPLAELALRIGLHMGEAQQRDGDYHGHALAVTARITDAGFGGQIVASSLIADVVSRTDRSDVVLVDRGEFQLRGVRWPERLYLVIRSGDPVPTGPLRISGRRMDNLPTPQSSFVGRSEELAAVIDLIRANPLVTLSGQGGVGKTRLAVEAALAVASDFRHGAWMCELADVESGESALPAVATSLGVRSREGIALDGSLAEHLSGRELLLLLDNCEHVLDPIARFVGRLVEHCPGVRVVATSREPLGGSPEVVYDVTPLTTTEIATDRPTLHEVRAVPAVDLLLDRADAVQHQGRLVESDAEPLLEISRRLDGLPLAIELAAARLRTMSPGALLARMEDRFDLLQTRHVLGSERHRTMENAVAWSYRLLTPREQLLFDRLAVFAGGFGVEGATVVCAAGDVGVHEVASLLSNLVQQSLVSRDDSDRDRFRLNETMRDFGLRALERRGEVEATRDRYLAYWESVVADSGPGIRTDAEAYWANLLDVEFGNIRAAYRGLLDDGDVDRLTAFLVPLYDFTLWRMRYEHGSWCVNALRRPGIQASPHYGDVAAIATYALWAGDMPARALAVTQRALENEERTGHEPSLLLRDAAASLSLYLRRLDDAVRYQREWEELAVVAGDGYRLARAAFTGSVLAAAGGDGERARSEAVRVMSLSAEIGNPTVEAWAHHALAQAARRDEPARAIRHFERSAQVAAEVTNRLQRGLALRELGELHASVGNVGESLATFRDVVRHWYRADDWANQWLTFGKLARLFRRWGLDEPAAIAQGVIAQTAEALHAASAAPGGSAVGPPPEATAGSALVWWERGHAMSRNDAYVWMNQLLEELQGRDLG